MVLVAQASAAASPGGEEAIRLARDKSALAEIVVPDEPGPCEQYAARELSDYFYRICGARFSILPEPQTSQRPRLFVGRTRAAAAALADMRGADVDSFAVRRAGSERLFVTGGSIVAYFSHRDAGTRPTGKFRHRDGSGLLKHWAGSTRRLGPGPSAASQEGKNPDGHYGEKQPSHASPFKLAALAPAT